MAGGIEFPYYDIKDRMDTADRFLTLGKREIKEGRARANAELERQGNEKVFHAFEEAATALVQKYGLPIPHNHNAIRAGLETKGERHLKEVYDDAFHYLHDGAYYRGWLDDRPKLDSEIAKVEKAIQEIARKLRK